MCPTGIGRLYAVLGTYVGGRLGHELLVVEPPVDPLDHARVAVAHHPRDVRVGQPDVEVVVREGAPQVVGRARRDRRFGAVVARAR